MADTGTVPVSEKKRVLVVDDSTLVRLYYRSALEKVGFRVDQALNGIEAMEKVLSQPFDLVIVDVNMPRMDGFAFLRSLRSAAAGVATLPALVISTEAESQDFADARTAGANYYLVKPVAEADLVRHVAVLTGSSP
jgi:two-component system chemotaxis response regulator CheY